MDPIKVLCYNKGCGLHFDPNVNEDTCCHHPGVPVFHDAYKKWSCCSKKTTDFTTFLNIKGCHIGKHNPEKPKVEPKTKPPPDDKEPVVMANSSDAVATSRVRFDATMTQLEVTVNQKLKDFLESRQSGLKGEQQTVKSEEIDPQEHCKNHGCKIVYEDICSKLTECTHHPGFPVFHEGLKFWSCCQKRTIDFDIFLGQKGCTIGSHLWKTPNVTQSNCRYDWHQTGQHVYITIYAKHCQPQQSSVKASQIRIYANIIFADNVTFILDRELIGVINPAESIVSMFPSKIEIKLRKAAAHNWQELFAAERVMGETKSQKNSADPKAMLDSVDLSDI